MSETTNLKLKKHDNVSTNTNQFDIDNYLNGNWDTIDDEVGEVRENITNLQADNETNITNIETLQTENADLKEKNTLLESEMSDGQAEGTSITVNDSANYRAKLGVGGNNEQETREGYNLLNIADQAITSNGITAVVKDGKITLNGTATETSQIIINLLENIITSSIADEYTISAFNSEAIGDDTNLCALRYNTKGTEINQANLKNINATGVIETNTTVTSISIRIASGINFNNFEITPQIALTTKSDTYEKYGTMPSPPYPSPVKAVGSNGSTSIVACNKNLLDLSNLTDMTVMGATLKKNSDGSFTLNGTTTNSQGFTIAIDKPNTLKANTNYTFKVLTTGEATSTSGSLIAIREEENTNLESVNFSGVVKTYTPTEDKNINYIRIYIDTGVTFTNFTVFPLLYEGTESTGYIPHQSQTYTIPTQQEMLEGDYFDWENEEEVHEWGKYELTGQETGWAYHSDSSRFYINKTNLGIVETEHIGKCTHFISENTEITNNAFNFGANEAFFRANNYSTTSEWKTYLAEQYANGTPVTVYYKLATPTRLPFTEDQKAVKEELNKFITYYGTTHIYSTDEIEPNMTLDYKKSNKLRLENLEKLVTTTVVESEEN